MTDSNSKDPQSEKSPATKEETDPNTSINEDQLSKINKIDEKQTLLTNQHDQISVHLPEPTINATRVAIQNGGEAATEKNKRRKKLAPLWTWRSIRFRIAFMLAVALSVEGFMRSNINMAIVCMVNQTAVQLIEGSSPKLAHKTPCQLREEEIGLNTSRPIQQTPIMEGDVVLNKQEQAMILSAFYLGGLIAALPSGYLCDKYGPREVVFYGALLNVLGTVLTPFLTQKSGALAVTIVRFLMGCGQVVLVPCMNVLIARWFPLAEKSTAIAIATTGNQISVIVALFLTAELCQFHWLGGWPSAFYFYAVLGAIFCVYWMYYVRDYPGQVKTIRPEEMKQIEESGPKGKFGQRSEVKTPWGTVFSSVVVWAIALSSFSQNFMNVGTVVYLPAYYQTVLGMKLTKNGIMSALPFIVQLITKGIFAGVADYLKHHKILSHTSTTKLFNLIASVGSGVCYIGLAYCDCSTPNLAILLAVAAVGLSSGFIPGYNTSVVCVAPRYTSAVSSFSRFLGQIASVVAPYMIGSIVVKGAREEWQIAFFIMAFVLISTGIFFQFGGSASIQQWARPETEPLKAGVEKSEDELQKPLTVTEST